jgi:hypothetical protein
MSGQQGGAARTRRTTPSCRVTRHCSGLRCMGNGSALHCCSPATSPVHMSCRHMVPACCEAPRRCAHSPKRDHDGHAQGISVTLIARRPLGLQGTCGGPGAAPSWAAGAEAAGHVAAPKLPRAGQWELRPQDTWRPRSWPGPCGSC